MRNDAFDLATPPPPTETTPERRARSVAYFKAMTFRYGSKWIDTFLDETSTFAIEDPVAFGITYAGKCVHKIYLNHNIEITELIWYRMKWAAQQRREIDEELSASACIAAVVLFWHIICVY